MSQQTSLETYFKNKSNVRTMESIQNTRKRRNLSLSTKNVLNNSTPNVNKVIDLCSDSENSPIEMEPSLNISQTSNNSLNSSQSTIIYSFTPKKTPNTSAGSFSGSSSSKKFFSPTKKRIVTKKSPVKRNLATSFGEPSLNVIENDVFTTACEGMDDKTIFLLTIINKYLKNDSLRSLLDEPAEQLLSKCLDIVKPGVRLVCRLYWYQPGWYRKDKIIQIFNNKKETIDDPSFQIIMNCLLDKGLIECSNDNSNISFEDFTKLLNFDEIRTVCKDLKIKIQTKQSAVEALRKFSRSKPISTFFNGGAASNDARLLDIMKSKVGICFKLSDAARDALYKLHLLMYLGINYETIREKKLELMLINDKINRETYPVDKGMKVDSAAVVFKTRDEFLRYMDAHIMYENYLSETDVLMKCGLVTKVHNLYKDISDQEMIRYKSFPIWLHRFTPPYIFVKILESGIQELKKIKCKDHYQVALDILSTLIEQVAFRQHKKGEWYAEKALILHKLVSRYDEAAHILLQGLKSNLREEYKATMKLRAIKLGRQLNIQLEDCLRSELIKHGGEQLVLEKEFTSDHVNKQHMDSDNKRGKKKFQVRSQDDIQYLEAEDYCIIHYLNNGAWTHGEHWEGRIITTLFFLLFWDIIYTKPRGVNGVFLSHYQMFPLDLYTESFYINRKTLIDERLASIEAMETDEMLRIIKEKWEERPEHELSAINRSIDYNNLSSVAGAAGGRRLAALCGRLAAHYGYAHCGFPDLTLWNVHTNQIKFVEVKTDTDKPSIKQLQWMQYLKEHGIDTGFCYVGVNTTRSKARGSASMIQFQSSPSD